MSLMYMPKYPCWPRGQPLLQLRRAGPARLVGLVVMCLLATATNTLVSIVMHCKFNFVNLKKMSL